MTKLTVDTLLTEIVRRQGELERYALADMKKPPAINPSQYELYRAEYYGLQRLFKFAERLEDEPSDKSEHPK